MTPEMQELWEERAAIIQYDGNLSREEAERIATEQMQAEAQEDSAQLSIFGGRS